MAKSEDALIAQLGELHQQLEQLENVDYMTAYYKGYSTQGDDLETIKEKIITVNAQIQRVARRDIPAPNIQNNPAGFASFPPDYFAF